MRAQERHHEGTMNDSDAAFGEGDGRALLVLVAGDAMREVAALFGEFSQWIERASPGWAGEWRLHDLRSDDPLPDCRSVAGILITGSISSVTERAPWMLRAEAYVREVVAAETPLLGICFGHQLMAQALGGDVQRNPLGREIGTVLVTKVGDDPLFAGLDDTFSVNATHVDSIVTLPPTARVIATSALEPRAAVDFGPVARGVQFHPEFDGAVMRGYLTVRCPVLLEEGLDADAMLARASDTPSGPAILDNFIRSFVLAPARRAA
jgi:GMP synthase (glutamine-hydrolysing)